MTGLISQIIEKYQGVAPQRVINAVQTASAKTGADFSFLMEKASTESGFNASAKAKSSSATGLFQFIDSTWLHMVKEYGPKFGLSSFAKQIECRDGKLCVDDGKTRTAILNLRKNPEIAALMAGELSADNKEYLQGHTNGTVGSTEMYMAHFLGAGGAAKFLNSREDNGDAVAASVFPKEARANKNVFFDSESGQPRTLNDIYDFFADKFNSGTNLPSHSAAHPGHHAETGSTPPAPAQYALTLASLNVAQALPSLNGGTGMLDWNQDLDNTGGFSRMSSRAPQKNSPETSMMIAQLERHLPHMYAARGTQVSYAA